MKTMILFTLVCCGACSRVDTPCPGIGTSITTMEADLRLAKAAQARAGKVSEAENAVRFDCHDFVSSALSQDGYAPQTVWLSYGQVLTCLGIIAMPPPGQTLSSCLDLLARLSAADKVIRAAGMTPTDDLVKEYALKGVGTCDEIDRKVEVPQDELRRDGVRDLIPVLLVVGARVLAGMASAATVPAGFILKPTGADEEACVDLPSEPQKKCSDVDCAPDGAEGPDGGGIALPPGVTPGDAQPGGDYP